MPLPTDPAELLALARAQNRAALARLLTMVESRDDAAAALAVVHPHGGHAGVVGFTGAPGAGKSTLVDATVAHVRTLGTEVAVLAVDPSSPFSGGAILGDRVRMQSHALDTGVFIRSMASRGALGGLAAAAPNAIRVLDAAGKPEILVETVGVGQVEIEIVECADTVVVVVNPGWGDAIQAAKAGLLEIADVFVVNKSDRPGADECVRDLQQMLDLAPVSDWRPPVVQTVAANGTGVGELWDAIVAHRAHLSGGDRLAVRRRSHLVDEVRNLVVARIGGRVRDRCQGAEFEALIDAVAARELDPGTAADRLLADAGLD